MLLTRDLVAPSQILQRKEHLLFRRAAPAVAALPSQRVPRAERGLLVAQKLRLLEQICQPQQLVVLELRRPGSIGQPLEVVLGLQLSQQQLEGNGQMHLPHHTVLELRRLGIRNHHHQYRMARKGLQQLVKTAGLRLGRMLVLV
jgi:hypothetical protein